MGFSYLLIIVNIGSSIVTKKKKKEAKIIMHLLLGLQLAKMSSPRKSQRTFFYRRLEPGSWPGKGGVITPGSLGGLPSGLLKISFRFFESLPKEGGFCCCCCFFRFRKHLLTSLVVQWLRLVSNGGSTGSLWLGKFLHAKRPMYIYIYTRRPWSGSWYSDILLFTEKIGRPGSFLPCFLVLHHTWTSHKHPVDVRFDKIIDIVSGFGTVSFFRDNKFLIIPGSK